MPDFKLVAPFEPTGDQPAAIEALADGIAKGFNHQVLLGVTGSGKSLAPDEPLLVGRQDDYGKVHWSVEAIGAFVDAALSERPTYLDDHGTEVGFSDPAAPGHMVVTLDPITHETLVRPVTGYSRHNAPPSLWRATMSDGRAVTVTGDHNFVRLGTNARLETIRTVELRPGDQLPIPASCPTLSGRTRLDLAPLLEQAAAAYVAGPGVLGREVAASARRTIGQGASVPLSSIGRAGVGVLERFGETRFVATGRGHSMPAGLPLSDDLLTFIGLFVAEGHVADRYATIAPGAEILDRVRTLATTLAIPTFERGPHELGIPSRIFAEVLRGLCGSTAGEKHLPSFWPDIDDHRLGTLLAGYFEGHGWVESSAVCATTKSVTLANELAYALLRFGIVARLAKRRKRAIGTSHPGADYWQVSIRGDDDLRAFSTHVGFVWHRKRRQLAVVLRRTAGGNADVLPPAGRWLRGARLALDLTQSQLGEMAGISRAAVSLLENDRRGLRRGTARVLVDALERRAVGRAPERDAVAGPLGAIRRLLACRWATVESIETVTPAHPSVYDLSVNGTETFLAGFGGLVVHNTYSMSQVIARANRPTLVLAHNKTLAAQLYAEFREFFPENAVEYFVSYFDYYQPEAYLPRSDTYIEKDSSRNDEIDRLRHAATHALFERRDVIIVASVSCIYGLGAPVDYGATVLKLRVGGQYRRDAVLRHLVDLQYQRNDQALSRARFRVRGDTLELQPASEETLIRVEFFGDEIERITELDPLTGELLAERKETNVYPATHYVTPADKLKEAIVDIDAEMEVRVGQLEAEGRALEGARLRQRTTFDLEMMRELGYCTGIENYSRHLSRREPGSRPWTLLDYFPPDWLLVVDESHMTIPQVVGMYKNDRTRKEILVDFGFRLPSALDNRPLTFEEFEATVHQAIYMSATPGPYELERSQRNVQQLIRPTGIVDPSISVRPTDGQIDDLLEEIRSRVERGERALVTTLTKKMAEDLADYLRELGVKVQYLHSEVDTLERVAILRDLRLGIFDVLVGINLLREGIDLPEVTLVAILDADKEGFLRSAWSLIQMIGRAARNIGGEVIMYADRVTESMRVAIDETDRRRTYQVKYNLEHGIEPTTIVKGIRDINERLRAVAETTVVYSSERGAEFSEADRGKIEALVARMEAEMKAAAKQLEFERAAALRDEIQQIRLRVLEQDASITVGRAAERAARDAAAGGLTGAADRARGRRGAAAVAAGQAMEVTSVTVLPADEEPAGSADGVNGIDEGTVADWLPGIRDEHEDDGGWQARWLDRPTWDRAVTPNIRKRTGQRPARRRR
jgi:excinuclease ABC B subunit